LLAVRAKTQRSASTERRLGAALAVGLKGAGDTVTPGVGSSASAAAATPARGGAGTRVGANFCWQQIERGVAAARPGQRSQAQREQTPASPPFHASRV
jgi:hypothetical protein